VVRRSTSSGDPVATEKRAEAPTAKEKPVVAAPPKQSTADKLSAQPKAAEPKSEEQTSPEPRAVGSSGNFAHQGGVNVIHDPDRDKPGVFKFHYVEEKQR